LSYLSIPWSAILATLGERSDPYGSFTSGHVVHVRYVPGSLSWLESLTQTIILIDSFNQQMAHSWTKCRGDSMLSITPWSQKVAST